MDYSFEAKRVEDVSGIARLLLGQAGTRIIKTSVASGLGERKGRSGRKKRISTAGYFCLNKDCEYYGITDEQIRNIRNWRGGDDSDCFRIAGSMIVVTFKPAISNEWRFVKNYDDFLS